MLVLTWESSAVSGIEAVCSFINKYSHGMQLPSEYLLMKEHTASIPLTADDSQVNTNIGSAHYSDPCFWLLSSSLYLEEPQIVQVPNA